MSVPTNGELAFAVNEILRKHDLEKITLRIVMTMLCERFSVSNDQLADQKRFVRKTINEFLEKTYVPPGESGDPAAEAPRTSNKRKAEPHATNGTIPGGGDDGEGDDDDDGDGGAAAAQQAAAAAAALAKPVKLTGLERAVVLAQPLAEFIGEVVIPRSHIPKRIAAYARANKLQDPSDGRRIVCDDALKKALNVDDFTFFTLSKTISGLVYRPAECDAELQEMAKRCEEQTIAAKMQKREADIANGVIPAPKKGARVAKKQKRASGNANGNGANGAGADTARRSSGLFKPMDLSQELQAVVGEPRLSRSDVLKKIWAYIRENGLKDPDNGMRVLCDEKLSAVMGGEDSVSNMGINKHLSAHMTKVE